MTPITSRTQSTIETTCELFRSKYAQRPTVVTSAPGRVNLIGEHIDYNDGIALPFAIDRQTTVAARVNGTRGNVRLISNQFESTVEFDLNDLNPEPNCWANYVKGVIAELVDLGVSVPGFDAAISSSIPIGSGLSSSAALEVATATALECLTNHTLSKRDRALLCQSAEHKFAGVPCGIMDQFASVFGADGHFVRIDCREQTVELLPATGLNHLSFIVIDSLATHELADGEYSLRRKQCEAALNKLEKKSFREVTPEDLSEADLTSVELKRARHVVSEIDRVEKTIESIGRGNWAAVGQLLLESHNSLCENYEVSCEELDFLVEQLMSLDRVFGVLGAKMTGAGFGGCVIAIVASDWADKTISEIQLRFREKYGTSPPAFLTAPSQGARIVSGKIKE